MKVLIINSSLHLGSVGKIASCMYDMLKKEGHDVRFLYGNYSEKPDNSDQICISTKSEQLVHKIYNCVSGYHSTFAPFTTKRIERVIKKFNPDIVQLYNLHGYYLDIYSLFRLICKYNIATVYSMIDEFPYLGYCTYAFDCEGFKDNCKGCKLQIKHGYMNFWGKPRGMETHNLKKKAYDSVNHIVFTGPQWVIERARASTLLKDKNLAIVDEFIDTDKVFTPRNRDEIKEELGILDGKIIVLNVARSDDSRKGINDYIEVAKSCSDTRYVFINVGYVSDKSVLPDNYLPIGLEYNQEKLAKIYSLADMLVCTSYADTMPNVCLDALSCGTPVVGYDITGVPYVADTPLGRFVAAGDTKALLDAIISNGKKTQEIAKRCREYALSRYSPSVYYEKSVAIYKKLLG